MTTVAQPKVPTKDNIASHLRNALAIIDLGRVKLEGGREVFSLTSNEIAGILNHLGPAIVLADKQEAEVAQLRAAIDEDEPQMPTAEEESDARQERYGERILSGERQ